MKDRLAIGYIRSAHGTNGALRVHSFSGESEHFRKLERLTLRYRSIEREYEVEEVFGTHPTLLVKLKGVDTREAAQRLQGWEIWVSREYAAPCREGEYYIADLEGCEVYSEGEEGPVFHGTIVAVIEAPHTFLLEVALPGGGRAMIPFQDHFVGEVDILRRRIELKTPWILE